MIGFSRSILGLVSRKILGLVGKFSIRVFASVNSVGKLV